MDLVCTAPVAPALVAHAPHDQCSPRLEVQPFTNGHGHFGGHGTPTKGTICIRGGVPQCVDECSKGLIMVPKLQAALADEGNRWVFKDIYPAIENGYFEPQNFFPQF